ncbi:MAG: AAA family ATPase, partial [Desulfurococcaceae archaeon]
MTVDNVKAARERLLAVEKALNTTIVGHEDMVSALLYASIAGEHVVFISPPGTAKTYLVKTFAKLLNAQHYSYLLTKFTSYDELFGAVDITALAQGSYKRNWSRLVSADIIFLDEVFKANSAILNALLSLLQERVVYDPLTGAEVQARLHTVVGASNEVPEDGELQALYDRFAIRVFSDYLSDDVMLLKALEARWANSNGVTAVA